MDASFISIVIPVYNEEGNIQELYRRLKNVLEEDLQVAYEIIFVDDGSKDESFVALRNLSLQNKKVKVIKFSRNFGQHAAMTAGFIHAQSETIIFMDADLQNPPEEIPKLLKEYNKGFDIVYGIREKRRDNLFRKISSKIINGLFKMFLKGESFYTLAAFRIMKKRTFEEIFRNGFDFGYVDYYSNWINADSGKVTVSHDPRTTGKSKYSFFKLVYLTLKIFINYTTVPLRLAVYTGIVISICAFIYSLFILLIKLIYEIDAPGYASLIIVILFFFGIQLIFLGIIGEYLGRIFIHNQNKPLYRIEEVLSNGKEKNY